MVHYNAVLESTNYTEVQKDHKNFTTTIAKAHIIMSFGYLTIILKNFICIFLVFKITFEH